MFLSTLPILQPYRSLYFLQYANTFLTQDLCTCCALLSVMHCSLLCSEPGWLHLILQVLVFLTIHSKLCSPTLPSSLLALFVSFIFLLTICDYFMYWFVSFNILPSMLQESILSVYQIVPRSSRATEAFISYLMKERGRYREIKLAQSLLGWGAS